VLNPSEAPKSPAEEKEVIINPLKPSFKGLRRKKRCYHESKI